MYLHVGVNVGMRESREDVSNVLDGHKPGKHDNGLYYNTFNTIPNRTPIPPPSGSTAELRMP